ncbi:MAG: AI-2E family transporter [Phycisphaerales bacterium]|nr:MAG: AI-2E family transporter [Phycisphaerales bacterium]
MPTQPGSSQPYTFDRIVRIGLGVAAAVVVVWLLRFLSDVLIPFAVAVLLAYLINPIVNAVESRLKNRVAATLITVFGCLTVLAALAVIMVPLVGRELTGFGEVIQQLGADAVAAQDGKSLGARFDEFVQGQRNETVRQLLISMRETVAQADLQALVVKAGRKLAPGLWNVVSGAFSFVVGLTGLVIVLLYVVFVSIDYARLSGAWRGYLPPAYRDRIIGFLTEFSQAMGRYFRGQFVIAATVGVLFAIAFSIIGLRMGILLGLFVGLLNMVPYLQTVGLVPALLLAVLRAVEGESSVLGSVVLVLIAFGVVQLIQDAILTPRIMGKQTGLRPVVILLSVFIWGKLLGFLGLVLAIPLTCLGVAFYRRSVLGDADASAIPSETTA